MNKKEQIAALRRELRDAIANGWQFTASVLRRDISDLVASMKADRKSVAGPIDIAWISEYGLEQKLSASIRCF